MTNDSQEDEAAREIGSAGTMVLGKEISVLNEIVRKCLMKMLTEH